MRYASDARGPGELGEFRPKFGVRLLRIAALGALTLCCMVATAGIADGATLQKSGSTLLYGAGVGETNNLVVKLDGPVYRFTDSAGVTIVPSGGCAAAANVGTCPIAGITSIQINLANLNDSGVVEASVAEPIDFIFLIGGVGKDTLTNASGVRSQIQGDDGSNVAGDDDVLTAGAADDALVGEVGKDTLNAGDGDDQLIGGSGSDSMDGGAGDDLFRNFGPGPDGADTFRGGLGRDRIDLGDRTGNLSLTLDNQANDGDSCPGLTCEGDDIGTDVELVQAGLGDDVIVGSADDNQLSGEEGDDEIHGGKGSDSISGGDDDDRLFGGSGDDSAYGGSGSDNVNGEGGDDQLGAETDDFASDRVSGGPGSDSLGFGEGISNFAVKISLDGRANDGARDPIFSSPLDNYLGDIEMLSGSDRADILIGSKGDQEIHGLGGADRISGGGGADGIFGDSGADLLTGGGGRDLIDGGAGNDRLNAVDHHGDELRCGAGIDRGKADHADRRGPDCDRVKTVKRKRGGKK